MIKIYDVYKNKRELKNKNSIATAFTSHDPESLKELISEKMKSALCDLTEDREAEDYILIYFPKIKHYCLDITENFIEEHPFVEWVCVGNIK